MLTRFWRRATSWAPVGLVLLGIAWSDEAHYYLRKRLGERLWRLLSERAMANFVLTEDA